MTATEIIAKAKELPVVSETASNLVIQLNQPDLHRDELVRTVHCDNVLTAKVLRACNSAASGVREPVGSLDQALLILGDSTIFRMVSAIGFGESLEMAAPGYANEANGLWAHSLSTGLGAEHLAGVISYGGFLPSIAFTAGLLHDIGKTVIGRVLTPKDRADIRAKIAAESVTRIEAERAVLGADHSEVGACLLKRWALPECIIEAAANHHHPVTKPAVGLSAVIYMANCAAHLSAVAHGCEAQIVQAKKTTAQVLGMDAAQIEEIFAGISGAMESLPQLMAAA
jgi:putative nucleotidyltransferase with HDIG domain